MEIEVAREKGVPQKIARRKKQKRKKRKPRGAKDS
jgi:hypothetical protein